MPDEFVLFDLPCFGTFTVCFFVWMFVCILLIVFAVCDLFVFDLFVCLRCVLVSWCVGLRLVLWFSEIWCLHFGVWCCFNYVIGVIGFAVVFLFVFNGNCCFNDVCWEICVCLLCLCYSGGVVCLVGWCLYIWVCLLFAGWVYLGCWRVVGILVDLLFAFCWLLIGYLGLVRLVFNLFCWFSCDTLQWMSFMWYY